LKFTSLLANRWLALLHDIAWIPVALIVGYWLRFNLGAIPAIYREGFVQFLVSACIIQTLCFWYFGLYRGIWRFASIPDIFRIIKSVIVGVSLTVVCVFFVFRLAFIPRSILILYPVFLFLGLSAPRLLYRWFKDQHIYMSQPGDKQALIIGAGQAGDMLIREILRTNEFLPVGFLDDAAHKKGRDIHGVRVLDSIENIKAVLEKYEIDVVIICIRNISAGVMRSILRACSNKKIECQTIPSLTEINDDNIDISRLRNIKLEDLLGRESVKLDDQSLHNFIGGECVLVSGAGGSIGSELCRQTIGYDPKKLILLEQSEFNLYTISKDLKKHEKYGVTEIIPMLRDVRDLNAIEEVFSRYRPNVVLHAAAYKHVPIIEDNIIEGVKTNVFGTKKLAELAAKYNVGKFVMVSTDKAVNPTSMMGTTKRTAEIFCQALDARTSTQFITTRFGNVIDSTGSVVPLFREQIQRGGPVTVTHKDVSRYFMSISEAVSLILQAASMGKGGEIFVLDMGGPVKIYDLARQMIRLSGYDPDHDIKIEFIGLRPGEKLYEELFHKSEDYTGTKHPKILLAESRKVDWDSFVLQLEDVLHACEQRRTDKVIDLLKKMIPEYVASQLVSADGLIEDAAPNIVH